MLKRSSNIGFPELAEGNTIIKIGISACSITDFVLSLTHLNFQLHNDLKENMHSFFSNLPTTPW